MLKLISYLKKSFQGLNINILGSIILMLLFVSCKNDLKDKSDTSIEYNDTVKLKYANGFKILIDDNYTKLIVENPWQKAKGISFEYVLSSKPDKNKNTINTPVKNVVCLSTTHVAYISAISKQSTISGITNSKLISDTVILQQLKNSKTHDVGNEQALNYETILSLNPDVIFAYGIGAEVQSVYHKFAEWGIPVVIIAEYLENTPLAKTEWLKFFSCFYNDIENANLIFDNVEHQYLDYTKKVNGITKKPTVMSSLPWKGVWYVPGGLSFMANFINDAGGSYLYKSDETRESLNLSIEQVMLDGKKADIWIHTGMANTIKDIEGADTRLASLPAYFNQQIYNNNKRQNKFGGNDFWESGVVNPHLILKDLIQIFHPNILSDTSLYYYQKLN